MVTRTTAPVGAPCWADLWTSDVEGSRRFYAELLGWEPAEPSPEFGGYFMFNRNGVPVAGGMGDMGDMPAQDVWKIYLSTDDVSGAVKRAEAEGAQISVPPSPVADLGTQAVIVDPGGAAVGIWQPASFPGFTVLGEPGSPSWFELFTTDYEGARRFYAATFGLALDSISDTDDFRYSTFRHADAEEQLGGIMDAGGLAGGGGSYWTLYWETADLDATVAKLRALGGAVSQEPTDTPYGRMATVADPTGAAFKLRQGA